MGKKSSKSDYNETEQEAEQSPLRDSENPFKVDAVVMSDLEIAQKQASDNLNMAKVIKAEFENYKRNQATAVSNAYSDGIAAGVKKILPIADALGESKKSISDEAVLKGIEILERKVIEALESLGVNVIESIGKPFDPNLHNAVAVDEESDAEPDTVVQEWQKGYTLNGKVIRPGMVKVSK